MYQTIRKNVVSKRIPAWYKNVQRSELSCLMYRDDIYLTYSSFSRNYVVALLHGNYFK